MCGFNGMKTAVVYIIPNVFATKDNNVHLHFNIIPEKTRSCC